MDTIVLVAIAFILGLLILVFPFLQKQFTKGAANTGENANNGGQVNADVDQPRVMAGGGRRARNRRNIARYNEDDELAEDGDEPIMPGGKVGTKKLRKLQAKADKKAMREQEQALREDEKKRKELRDKERKEKEDALKIQQLKEEEKELKLKLENEEREHQEYLKLKESFIIEEEGEKDAGDEERTLNEFIQHIKDNKVVFLEDLAAEFSMKTQDVIDRIQGLQKSGQLSGVIDDRGKFIYISNEELRAVAKFMKQRGRVSISELAQSSNSLITLK